MKKRLLCPILPQKGSRIRLSTNEAHHATRVLRLRNGETIEAIDGNGNQVLAALRIREEVVELEFCETLENTFVDKQSRAPVPLILEIAVLKGEAMEWVVEKSVELGVQRLVPIWTAHTVVQMKNRGPESFRERWQKIADQALKQCGRLNKMLIEKPIPFSDLFLDLTSEYPWKRFWCDEASGKEVPYFMDYLKSIGKSPKPLMKILIGPEGGWSATERILLEQQGSPDTHQRISLGPLILRSETAALFAISLASAHIRSSESH